jgi:rubredoxin
LVRAFDRDDLRTFGICFGIKTIPKTEVFASIMIRQRPWKLFNFLPIFKVYDISYTQDFDPNGRTKIYFAQGVSYLNLAEQLRRSILFYNKKIAENSIEKLEIKTLKKVDQPSPIEQKAYQCPHCQTIYDPSFGDELNGIEAGILFDTLPQNYSCATCQAPKVDFLLLSSLQV